MIGEPPAATEIAQAVETVCLLPDETRRFDVDVPEAGRVHALQPDLLDRLVDAGLPHREQDGLRFDACDLANAALHLGVTSHQVRAMRSWASTLTALGNGDAVGYDVTYYSSWQASRDEPPRSLAALVPGGRVVSVLARSGSAAVRLCGAQAWSHARLDGAVRDLLAGIASLRFCMLPAALRTSTEFARCSGVADCVLASQLVVDGCRRLGVAARRAFGLLLSSPFSTPHHWAEIEQGGEWIAVDPLLLAALGRHAGLDSGVWPWWRSPGGLFLGLGSEPRRIVSNHAVPIQTTFATRLSGATAASGPRVTTIP